jgi:hypothetical protein
MDKVIKDNILLIKNIKRGKEANAKLNRRTYYEIKMNLFKQQVQPSITYKKNVLISYIYIYI